LSPIESVMYLLSYLTALIIMTQHDLQRMIEPFTRELQALGLKTWRACVYGDACV